MTSEELKNKLIKSMNDEANNIFLSCPSGVTVSTHKDLDDVLTMEKMRKACNTVSSPVKPMSGYCNAILAGHLGSFAGIRVIEDPTMVEQYRTPRSKSKRINKKWSKDPRNFRPSRHLIMNKRTSVMYCHPAVALAMKVHSEMIDHPIHRSHV